MHIICITFCLLFLLVSGAGCGTHLAFNAEIWSVFDVEFLRVNVSESVIVLTLKITLKSDPWCLFSTGSNLNATLA